MSQSREKVMSASEAIRQFVKDGDELVIGNYTLCTCAELVYEVVRQKKKNLTVYSQSGIFDVEVMVAAGIVDRLITTYALRSGGRAGGSAVERALKAGTLELEDYTNYNYNARLVAGMHGFSFMQVFEGIIPTDLFKIRGFMGDDKYRIIDCPYTGKKVLTVPAANPDICIVHVPRADKYGNAQYWGAMGSVAAAALSSKRIIISCEEIVDHEVIQASPHHTIIPGFRADAVIEVPWGAHPTEIVGYYNMDMISYGEFISAAATGDGMQAWMDEWVYGCPSRSAYVDHYIEKFGSEFLEALRAKDYYSAPVNLGSAFTTPWKHDGTERIMGVTLEELETIMNERGLFHDS